MIDTVLFDIGTVLVRFDWEKHLRRMLPDENARRRVDETMFRIGLWDEVDRGVWTEQEVLDAFVREAPEYREDILRVYHSIGESLHKEDYADAWIDEIKGKGKRVLFLSNYARYIIDKTPQDFSFLKKMDGGVFSCDVHLLKPDPAIYLVCLEKYRLTPARCLFIDDRRDNCEAAEACGIHAVHFQCYAQAHAEANRLMREQE